MAAAAAKVEDGLASELADFQAELGIRNIM